MQRDKLELLLEKTQTVFDIEDLASGWDYLDYKKENYNLSFKERVICDSLYISPERLLEISQIYRNKRLEKEIQKIVKNLDR